MIRLAQEAGMLFTLTADVGLGARPEAQLVIASRPEGTPEELRKALHDLVDGAVDELIAFRKARVAQA